MENRRLMEPIQTKLLWFRCGGLGSEDRAGMLFFDKRTCLAHDNYTNKRRICKFCLAIT